MKRNFAFFSWREFTRSASFGKNMAAKGVLIFLAIYFSVSFLFLGFSLSMFLAEKFPGQSVVSAFNSMILIYAGADLVLRIFIQNLPTFGVQPFLVLPVKKRRIARYMLNKSAFRFFNILPFMFTKKYAASGEKALLISSHDLDHVADVCTRIVILEKGEVVKDVPKTETTLAELEEFFTGVKEEKPFYDDL